MYKKIIIITLVLWVLPFGAQAQKTMAVADPVSYYNRAVQLYDKEQYASAMAQFEDYIQIGKDAELVINAKYYIAIAALHLGHDRAEEGVETFIETYPGHIKTQMAHFQLARYYYNNGNYNKVGPQLKKTSDEALTFDESLEYHFMLGYSAFKKAKWDEAKPEFTITSNDKTKYYYPSHYYLGYIALKQGEYDNALTHFEKVKSSKIYGPEIPLYIAQIQFGAGKYQLVLDITDTMQNNPNRREINWMRGQCHYYLENYAEALPLLEQNQPPVAKMGTGERYILGYANYANGKYEQAYEWFTQINKVKDTVTQYAYYNAAECFLHLDRKTNARDAFYQASLIEYNQKLKERSLFNYAKLSYDLGFNSEALASLTRFIKEFPKSDLVNEAKTLQGEVLLVNKNYKDAIGVLESIPKMNEQTKRVYQQICFYHAVQLIEQGWHNADEAIQLLDKTKKYNYDDKIDALADFWKGEIAYHQKRYWDCIKLTREFLNYSSASTTDVYASAYYNTGYSYIKIAYEDKNEGDVMTHWGKAADAFAKYVDELNYTQQQKEQYLDGLTRLADCNFVLKKYEAATQNYTQLITKNAPSADYAYFQLGTIHGLQGNDELKIATLKKIPALFPRSKYIDDALYEIAMVHLNTNNNAEAERGFGYLLGENPNGAYAVKCHLRLGILYFRQNKNDKAQREFETVIEKFGKTPEAAEAEKSLQEIYENKGDPNGFFEYMENKGNKKYKDSDKEKSYYDNALSRYNDENCPEAVKGFTNYLKNFPNGSTALEAHLYRANCQFKLQKLDDALADYLYVIEKRSSEFGELATRMAATIYYLKKNYAGALPMYEQLEGIAQEKENVLVSLLGQMRCSYYLDNTDKTLTNSKKLLAYPQVTREGIIEANLYLSRIYIKQQSWDEADKASREVLKLTNNQYAAEAKYYIAVVQYKKGKPGDAEKTILELVKNFDSYDYWKAKALLLNCDILIDKKETFQARAILKSIIEGYETEDDGIVDDATAKLEQIGEE